MFYKFSYPPRLRTPNSESNLVDCKIYPKVLISIYHSMLYLTQRRGEAEFAEVIPLLEHVFVFTNWVKFLV